MPLVAADPRITAAVFGPRWPDALAAAARRITVPTEFDLQWDDEHIPREAGLALFDAFASAEKTVHADAGRHEELPRFEADSAVRFFARHLRAAQDPVDSWSGREEGRPQLLDREERSQRGSSAGTPAIAGIGSRWAERSP